MKVEKLGRRGHHRRLKNDAGVNTAGSLADDG